MKYHFFFYLSISKKTDTVTNWYTGNTINIWNVVAQDLLYGLCGVIIALSIFNYLCKKKIISKKYLYFVLVLIGVQLVGDLTFATQLNHGHKNIQLNINYFKTYINKSKFNALIGDSIWIICGRLPFIL